MKVLILHASLGSGHVSAAAAIEEALVAKGVEVRTEDALEYTNAALRGLVKTIITRFSQEAPGLYRSLYEGTDTGDPAKAMEQNELYGRLQAPMYHQLTELIEEYQPDRILCAQQLPALIVHALSDSGEIDIPWYITVTDYMAHSSWILSDVDGYFVPWDGVADVLVSWGVPERSITVSGIPVKSTLRVSKPADQMRERHGLGDGPVVTMIASGIDTDRFADAVGETVVAMDRGVVVVVAGRNDTIGERLADIETPPGVSLRVLGFIDYLDDLVAASDVVMTKSGGLITTEVLVRGVPMVVFDPFPGQEEWNADFVAGIGAGVPLRIPGMVGLTIAALLADDGRQSRMRAAAIAEARPDAADVIADVIVTGRGTD